MELARALKEIRKFSGFTQTEVCDRFNIHPYVDREISKSILSKMERGDYRLKASDMIALCDIYGLSLDTLRDVMEKRTDAFDAVRTKKQISITTSYMIADGGFQGGIISFPIGARVLVDTHRTPESGDLVAIRSQDMDENSAAVRKFTRSLGAVLLIADDKNYPPQPINSEINVLGVVQDVILKDIL